MQKYTFVVFSEATAGEEVEYHRWYNEQHLPDVIKVPGFLAAQRFKLFNASGNPSNAATFLALYEVETDDLEKCLAEMRRRAGTPQMILSDAIDLSRTTGTMYAEITPRITRAGND